MLYRTKVLVVEALQLSASLNVDHVQGGIGDWLVIGEDGKGTIKSDSDFRRLYEPADEDEVPTRFALERKRQKAGRPRATVPQDLSALTPVLRGVRKNHPRTATDFTAEQPPPDPF